MSKKNYFMSMLTMLVVAMLSVGLASCGSDSGNDNPNNGQPVNPGTTVSDPTGTVTLAMRNYDNGRTYLDNIYIRNENFQGAMFVSLGAVKGLGNVSTIPTSGWANQVAVVPGYGYVAYDIGKNQFYRIYVVDEISGTSGGVLGADIKYQKPFKGSDETISIDEKTLSFTNTGGGQSIVFNNKNLVLFDAYSDQSWCKVNKSTTYDTYFLYNAISIYVDAKTTPGTDEATVTIETAYNRVTKITVTRMGSDPVLELAENEKTITAEEQTFNVGFSTNYSIDNMEIENTNDWLNAEIVNGTSSMKAKAKAIRFIGKERQSETQANTNAGSATSYSVQMKASANYDNQTRTGKITLRSKDKKLSQTLTVKQTGAELAFTKDAVEFECAASTSSMAFTSPIATKDLQVKSNASWCTAELKDKSVALTVTANQTSAERKAQITLSTTQGNASVVLTVTQKKGEMSFDDASGITVANKAGTATAKFTSPYEKDAMKVSSNANWCTAELKDKSVALTVAANQTTAERKAQITLSTKQGNVSTVLSVTQKKGEIVFVDATGISMGNKAGTATAKFTSPYEKGALKVSSNASWCTPTISSDSQLSLTATENPSDKARTATITLSSNDGKMKNTLKVTQAAATMEVQSKVWLDRNASTQTLTLTTSLTSWTAKSNVSWCTLSQNGNQLTIRIEATTADRTGTISFDGLSTTIQLIQSKYAVGDDYKEGTLTGKVLTMNGANRVIYQALGNYAWSTENVATGATDEHDGKKNMEVIKKIPNWKTLYPAFAAVDALNINGETGWIFPARNQSGVGNCWTSTEYNSWDAYILYRYSSVRKDQQHSTIAIHMF